MFGIIVKSEHLINRAYNEIEQRGISSPTLKSDVLKAISKSASRCFRWFFKWRLSSAFSKALKTYQCTQWDDVVSLVKGPAERIKAVASKLFEQAKQGPSGYDRYKALCNLRQQVKTLYAHMASIAEDYSEVSKIPGLTAQDIDCLVATFGKNGELLELFGAPSKNKLSKDPLFGSPANTKAGLEQFKANLLERTKKLIPEQATNFQEKASQGLMEGLSKICPQFPHLLARHFEGPIKIGDIFYLGDESKLSKNTTATFSYSFDEDHLSSRLSSCVDTISAGEHIIPRVFHADLERRDDKKSLFLFDGKTIRLDKKSQQLIVAGTIERRQNLGTLVEDLYSRLHQITATPEEASTLLIALINLSTQTGEGAIHAKLNELLQDSLEKENKEPFTLHGFKDDQITKETVITITPATSPSGAKVQVHSTLKGSASSVITDSHKELKYPIKFEAIGIFDLLTKTTSYRLNIFAPTPQSQERTPSPATSDTISAASDNTANSAEATEQPFTLQLLLNLSENFTKEITIPFAKSTEFQNSLLFRQDLISIGKNDLLKVPNQFDRDFQGTTADASQRFLINQEPFYRTEQESAQVTQYYEKERAFSLSGGVEEGKTESTKTLQQLTERASNKILELVRKDQEKFLKITSLAVQSSWNRLVQFVQEVWDTSFPGTLPLKLTREGDFTSISVNIDPENPENTQIVAEIKQTYQDDPETPTNIRTVSMKATYDLQTGKVTYSPMKFIK